MQTKTKSRKISSGTRSCAFKRTREFIHKIRDGRAPDKALTSCLGDEPGFLNVKFPDIITEYDVIDRDEFYEFNDIDKQLSWQHLYDSAKNYCRLLGKEFNPELTGNIHGDILAIYKELKFALPENQELNIDVNLHPVKFLYFIVHGQGEFPDQFLFLPLKPVGLMPPELAELFIEFVRFYSYSQSVPLPDEHMDYDYIVTSLFPEYLEFPDEAHEHDIEIAKNYAEGIIPETFKKLSKMVPLDPVDIRNKCREAIVKFQGKDLQIIESMLEGIELFGSGTIGEFGTYDAEKDSLSDEYNHYQSKVEFQRTLAIIWDDEDMAGDYLQEAINNDIGEFGCNGPNEYLMIYPDTQKPLVFSDYPMQFYKWFVKLFEILDEYEQNNGNADQ